MLTIFKFKSWINGREKESKKKNGRFPKISKRRNWCWFGYRSGDFHGLKLNPPEFELHDKLRERRDEPFQEFMISECFVYIWAMNGSRLSHLSTQLLMLPPTLRSHNQHGFLHSSPGSLPLLLSLPFHPLLRWSYITVCSITPTCQIRWNPPLLLTSYLYQPYHSCPLSEAISPRILQTYASQNCLTSPNQIQIGGSGRELNSYPLTSARVGLSERCRI